ncbi:hypothetical protein C0992_004486 [Termitomyces sp. T32_za158]|nr:hypothetical protein C0992_004486 [Termitomyces sp. T32_za158]
MIGTTGGRRVDSGGPEEGCGEAEEVVGGTGSILMLPGWICRHHELLDGVAGTWLFILDSLHQVQPRYRLPPQVPEGMRVLEDAEETHRRLSFTSRQTLERLAMNLGEDALGLELAVQEQWQDMVRSLGVIEAEETEAMEVDLTAEPQGSGGVVDLRTGEAVGERSSGRRMGMDLDN